MIDSDRLKGEIKANGFTQKTLSERLGISVQTLNRKLSKGVFNSDEIFALINVLNIEEPMKIFFKS